MGNATGIYQKIAIYKKTQIKWLAPQLSYNTVIF